MPAPLRITAVNAAYDAAAADLDALLGRYDTLTQWCDAVAAAGAAVHVVQRFAQPATRSRGAVTITAVHDGEPPLLPPLSAPPAILDAVAATRPDVVHVNGLGFPALVGALRARCGPPVRIVVQDHAGVTRPLRPGLRGGLDRRRWRAGLAGADAVSFTAVGQAEPWKAAGVLGPQRVLALLESSTSLVPTPRDEARRRTRLSGRPLLAWIGRLTPSKDPLTVLDAFAATAAAWPDAHLAMIFQGGPLSGAVEAAVARTAGLGRRVTLVGAVPHRAVADYLGAADVYVSGSRAEGSGYALIEAMACGVVPAVTDIPSFAAIAGDCGIRWPAGDRPACTTALLQAFAGDLAAESRRVGERFARELAWPVIGARTIAAYADLAVAAGSR